MMVSIHAPREGCDKKKQLLMAVKVVSIHAPREGCDLRCVGLSARLRAFQFTHPGRGATGLSLFYELQDDGFNSRTPGGVRLIS